MTDACAQPVEPILHQAIDWMVLLRSGDISTEQQASFEHWLAAAPAHRAAWAQVTGRLDDTFEPLRTHAAHASAAHHALQADAKPRNRRRRTRLTALAILLGSTWLAEQYTPLLELSADLHTASGERRNFTLPDGSTVTLAARSAADILFDGQERRVRLRAGELVATVTPDATQPFVVETHEGQVRVHGKGAIVRQETDRSFAAALDEAATVTTRHGARTVLHRGEATYFERLHVARPRPRPPEAQRPGGGVPDKNLS